MACSVFKWEVESDGRGREDKRLVLAFRSEEVGEEGEDEDEDEADYQAGAVGRRGISKSVLCFLGAVDGKGRTRLPCLRWR